MSASCLWKLAIFSVLLALAARPSLAVDLSISNEQATNDATHVYYQFQYTGSVNYFRIYIDTDRNPATGYSYGGVGADYLIENGHLYRYSGTGGINWNWTSIGAISSYSTASGLAKFTVARSSIGETLPSGEASDLLYEIQGTARLTFPKFTQIYSAPLSISSGQASNDAINAYYQFQYTGSAKYFRVYIDTDRNSATGFSYGGVGADYLIENGHLYRYSGTGPNWSWASIGAISSYSTASGLAKFTVTRSSIGETLLSGEASDLLYEIQDTAKLTLPKFTQIYTYVVDPGPPSSRQSPTSGYSFAGSAMSYAGASGTKPFTASDPYILNVMGTNTLYNLGGSPRTYDLSGNAPFINPVTNVADPALFQGWDPTLNASVNIASGQMTNAGFPGRIDKTYGYTMVRYNAGDGITGGKCRTQELGFAIPPRTHVRWEFAVSFGANDLENPWALTTPGASPVLFWQTKAAAIGNPSLSAFVDTDPNDPTHSLRISFAQRGGVATKPSVVGTADGIKPHTVNYITIEAFLDERETINGGQGLERAWVNGKLIVDKQGPTLGSVADYPDRDFIYNWSINMYLYNEPLPYAHTRASFWKTAQMFVYPLGQ